MANTIVTQFSAMSAENRADLIETRADMASTVLNILLIAMENDSSPTEGVIINTISAAIELLNVPQAVSE